MWQKFAEQTRKVIYYAQEEAVRLGANRVGPEHLLLGMTRVPEGPAAETLIHLGVDPGIVRTEVEARVTPQEVTWAEDLQLTSAAKTVVDLADAAAKEYGDVVIGSGYLLLALIDEKESVAAQVLTALGVTRDAVAAHLRQKKEKSDAELLTLDEAVQFLGTSKPTLYRVLGQGDIKGLKVGRQWRFRRADLVAYMERSPVAVSAAPSGELAAELMALIRSAIDAGRGDVTMPPPGVSVETPEGMTVWFADLVVAYAVALHASDVHLEPLRRDGVTVLLLRYRIDGVLQEMRQIPMSLHESLMAHFKTKADMNISEKRVPQDGRFLFRSGDKEFDLRVSVVPSISGESLVMRIILKNDVLLGLENLGLAPDDLSRVRGLVSQPNGLFIATGPTGSGKTTLIYGCLQEITRIEVKTLTVEDPVELQMPYVTQVQVNKRAGVSFPAALRSFLRQDPDIIFVGEARDLETAALAVEASLIGHLVLMAMHANDAPAALTRLLEMGLEPYLIAATVSGILAQRLCRRICDDCKEAYQAPARELMRFGLEPEDADQTITLYRGRGCDQCRRKGYRGRTGLFELLILTDELADLIVRCAPPGDIAAAARAAGMNSLWQDGLRKILGGVTTPDEVLRVCAAI